MQVQRYSSWWQWGHLGVAIIKEHKPQPICPLQPRA